MKPRPWLAVGLLLTVVTVAGCGVSGSTADPSPAPSATTGPPPGASQAPGPPLATASAPPTGEVDRKDPSAVAADCFTRWQSFDARTDPGPAAGVERARDCLTEDFAASLGAGGAGAGGSGTAAGGDGQAWQEVRAAGTHSRVTVLATTPLGGIDTTATGRVVLQLNVRRETAAGGAAPVVTLSTPALTLLRQTDGTWRVAGADLSSVAGDAPGR
ncbi:MULTISPECIES: hypothetical protein [unclassified Frankia]|uniref:hypothetical protein n=1 Tax=unclassified Frankia TaxID=2632575 RepID=UPI000461EA64|nr:MULTISPECIES: hypothetical protein [unclassified Frankia]KDA44358.1 hypothetical protein BMG523Draft_00857 [Frankia sp. BMG5.23]KEZ35048.1 hypothetical protein CEDDRAFT_03598 [Frankia sp. CeD]ORT53404.1 hypothetical protein KBI5_07005 [Frankia sp. KB5]